MGTEIGQSSDWMDFENTAALYLFGDRVDIGVKKPGLPETCAVVDRADFLAAVASELNVRIVPADAIVIERSELPAVFVTDSGRILAGEHGARIGFADDPVHTAELYRALAAQDLAVEDQLIELRDARISVMGPANGFVVREKDGTPSGIMRIGTRDGMRIGLEAALAALEIEVTP